MKHRLKQLFLLAFFSMWGVNSAFAITKTKSHKKPHVRKIKSRKNKQLAHNHKPKKSNYMLGTASYYGDGDGFDGRQMANGETFKANDIYSAAHPTLPLGTKLMVTNLANGRSLFVEVRDRMPRGHRVIDLSDAAAKYLGMHQKGVAKVQLVKVNDEMFEKNKRYLEVDDNDLGTPG